MSLGVLLFFVNVFRTRRRGVRVGNDPWIADTLEWYAPSPPPPENFPQPVPYVSSPRPLRDLRLKLKERDAGAAPSPWLRLMALGASAATLLAVISGAASLGAAHQLLSALALPPLVAVLVAAWLGHRRLVVPAAGSRSRSSGSRR